MAATGTLSFSELRNYFNLGSGGIAASQLRGITGELKVSAFYGKRNLEITSTILANNIATDA